MKYFSRFHNKVNSLRPPDLYEYFVDNYWFKSVDLENQKINEPLRGKHKADVVIVGGGYTGMSAAFHIKEKFPEKHIVLLEGACCGYGASGRNGGFCISTDLISGEEDEDSETLENNLEVSKYGLNFIKRMISDYGVDCDLVESGMLEVALSEKHIPRLEELQNRLKSSGLDSTLLHGKYLETEIKSPRFIAGLRNPHGANLNPAKLARGMKEVIEKMGVEVRERTVVTRVRPGKINHIDTELGEISAPDIVIALNGYAHKLGFFKDRVFPLSVFQIATEPLSKKQQDEIGWQNRQGLSDMRTMFSYSIMTADNRIVMGGTDFAYYDFDAISSGNDKKYTRTVTDNLFHFFPQLKGLAIDHTWGGTTTYTLNESPSVGVMGDEKNIYYGVGMSEGVPTSQTFGRIIADLMAGESNAFTNHYIVNHPIGYAGPRSLRGVFGRALKWVWTRAG
jgi:glycine/D-amino acid oxidase-like deaminating enzyme